MISKVESFLCPDKQGTSEEGWRIQWPKHSEKNNKDEDNSLKTLTDKNHQALFQTNPSYLCAIDLIKSHHCFE